MEMVMVMDAIFKLSVAIFMVMILLTISNIQKTIRLLLTLNSSLLDIIIASKKVTDQKCEMLHKQIQLVRIVIREGKSNG